MISVEIITNIARGDYGSLTNLGAELQSKVGRFGENCLYFKLYTCLKLVGGVDFGTGDFTFAFWIKPKAISGLPCIIGDWADRYWGGIYMPDNDATGQGGISVTKPPYSRILTTSLYPKQEEWGYVTVCRKSGVSYLTFNGSLMCKTSDVYNLNIPNLFIGWDGCQVGCGLDGWLDDVVILRGTGLFTNDFDIPKTYLLDYLIIRELFINQNNKVYGYK